MFFLRCQTGEEKISTEVSASPSLNNKIETTKVGTTLPSCFPLFDAAQLFVVDTISADCLRRAQSSDQRTPSTFIFFSPPDASDFCARFSKRKSRITFDLSAAPPSVALVCFIFLISLAFRNTKCCRITSYGESFQPGARLNQRCRLFFGRGILERSANTTLHHQQTRLY